VTTSKSPSPGSDDRSERRPEQGVAATLPLSIRHGSPNP
jgi:hypothetical protein